MTFAIINIHQDTFVHLCKIDLIVTLKSQGFVGTND